MPAEKGCGRALTEWGEVLFDGCNGYITVSQSRREDGENGNGITEKWF